MVGFIAKVAFGVRKVVTIPGFTSVQTAAFGHGGILIFIDVVAVFVVFGSKVSILAGAFQLFIKERIFAGGVQFSVAVNGQHQPGGAFDQVVAAHIKVSKCKFAVLDLGGCDQAVFLQNRQVVGIPTAVSENGGVPDGRTIFIGDFRMVHDAGNTIRVVDIFGSV